MPQNRNSILRMCKLFPYFLKLVRLGWYWENSFQLIHQSSPRIYLMCSFLQLEGVVYLGWNPSHSPRDGFRLGVTGCASVMTDNLTFMVMCLCPVVLHLCVLMESCTGGHAQEVPFKGWVMTEIGNVWLSLPSAFA